MDADIFGLSFVVSWAALFVGWPYLDRQGFPNFPIAPAPPAPKRPLWRRVVRGTLAVVGGIALTLFVLVILPIALCFWRAQNAHDSVHVGMTVAEVLHSIRNCDIFQAASDFPYDEKADGDNIPAMNLAGEKTALTGRTISQRA